MLDLNNIAQNGLPLVIAGPCSAESPNQLMETCKGLAESGKVNVLRAGIWKPRTRPGGFEGVGGIALDWLKEVKEETGMLTTVEVATTNHVEEALKSGVDILWIGARTTVNPFAVQDLAEALKGTRVPVMIKNPVNPDLKLWIGAIERFQNANVGSIGAIHRGFSVTDNKKYRNAPMWRIPIALKQEFPDIPIINDPSHIAGKRNLIFEILQQAMDMNYDGLMVEVHREPENAYSDSEQQLNVADFVNIITRLELKKPGFVDENLINLLHKNRERIDEIDHEIVRNFGERYKIARQIGQYKSKEKVAILQRDRWAEILESRMTWASEEHISEDFIKRIYNLVHDESIRLQSKIGSKDNMK